MVTLGENLVEATFLRREKRFIVYAKLGSRTVQSFLSNTGTLDQILKNGAHLLLRPTKPGSRLPFQVLVAFEGNTPVVVDSQVPNNVIREALANRAIQSLPSYSDIFPEKKVDGHRIDFYLADHNSIYLEVKGCTLKTKRTVLYPDAPTERGVAHLKLLSRLHEKGHESVVIFLAMRSDVSSFQVNSAIDPEFSRLLSAGVERGVKAIAYSTNFRKNQVRLGTELKFAPGWPPFH